MSREVYSVAKLRTALEVRSFIDPERTEAFTELIVYKDWNTGTEVHFRIVQTGPQSARRIWSALGVTPWAWRYIPLGDNLQHPYFTFVLNRLAELKVNAFDKTGKEANFPPKAHYELVGYSELFVRWSDEGNSFATRPCVPYYSVRRPQTAFHPLGLMPDQVLEIGSSAIIYYPRDPRDRMRRVRTEPVRGGTLEELKKQVRQNWSRRNLRTDTSWGSEYVISSSATGHAIQSVDGEYGININIDNMLKPADYNFSFRSREKEAVVFDGQSVRKRNWDELEFLVHHGPNVSIDFWAQRRPFELETTFRELREVVVGAVAPLGDSLPPSSQFKSLTRSGGNDVLKALYTFGTFALAFVPVWGWLASFALTVGELVYAYNTGRDYFGETVTPTEFAALGVLGIAGTVGDALGAIRVGSRIASISPDVDDSLRLSFGQVRHEYDVESRGSIEAVERGGDQPLAKLIASLTPEKHALLAKIGMGGLEPKEYLHQAGELLNRHMGELQRTNPDEFQVIVVSVLEGLLTPDGQSLAHDYLREAYAAYRRNPKTKDPVPPITWLWRSKSGRVSDFLRSAIGENYRHVIRQAQIIGTGKRIVLATEENIGEVIGFYTDLSRLGLVPYEVLEDIRKLSKYDKIRGLLRDCFQFEHPVELRFVRNLDGRQHFKIVEKGRVRWALDKEPLGHDVESEFHAIVVPRTPRHALLLQSGGALHPTSGLLYSQHPKTGKVASWIPHGAEHLATPQEMADAVCAALLEANFGRLSRDAANARSMMDRLRLDFETTTDLINEVRGTSYPYPVLTHNLGDLNPAMKPGGIGWPRYRRDNRGVWSIVNKNDVEKARADRLEWAHSRQSP